MLKHIVLLLCALALTATSVQAAPPVRQPASFVPDGEDLPGNGRLAEQGSGAITANHLGFNISRTTTGASQSISIGANRLALLWITEEGAGQTPATVTDANRTWTHVIGHSDGLRRTSVFRSMSSSATNGAFTITTIPSPDGKTVGLAWSLVEYTNVDTSGTNGSGAVAQAAARGWKEDTNDFSLYGSINLAPSSVGGGAVAAGFALHNRSKEGVTAGAGYTLIGPIVCVSVCVQPEFRNSFARLADMSWGPLTSHYIVTAVELKPAGAVTAPPPSTPTPAPTAVPTAVPPTPLPTVAIAPTPTVRPTTALPTATAPAPTPTLAAPTATNPPGPTPTRPPTLPTATAGPGAPTALPPAQATPVSSPAAPDPAAPPGAAATRRPIATPRPSPAPLNDLDPTPTPEAGQPPGATGCNGAAPDLAWLALLVGVAGLLAAPRRWRGRRP